MANFSFQEPEPDPEPPRVVIAPKALTGRLRLVSDCGTHIDYLYPGEEKLIHPSLFAPAIIAGCRIPGGAPGQEVPEGDVVAELEEAMRLILAAGDPNKLSKTGEPMAAALKMYVANFTSEQRRKAWDNVSTPVQGEDD